MMMDNIFKKIIDKQIKANIAYALKRPDLRGALLEWMAELVRTEKP